MSATLILLLIAAYFCLLLVVSFFTGKDNSNDAFFIGNKKSPWYVVAFGMIGASLSGVTFISVPGWVAASQFSYMEMVLGYLVGYFLIATVLMPMYYRLNLTSIYTYLEQRFGAKSYKTGAGFFLLSRTIGAAFRLYLVAIVLQTFVMSQLSIPFWLTVLLTILLIWIYTFRGGIKTIIWTDTLQTLCMLAAVIFTIFAIGQSLELSVGQLFSSVYSSEYSQIFFFENGWSDSKNFVKQFLAGASIAFVMTGLDQDMMQKNLSCKNIKEAQLNMASFSIVLVFVNLLFLSLGALLYIFAAEKGIALPEKSDLLYATIALEHLSPFIGITFILGLIAAAYSSADSALTALTTSVCVDILNFRESKDQNTIAQQHKTRFIVHIGVSIVLFFTIILFWFINDDAVISQIFKVAGYTYGPLLGLYVFGFFTKMKPNDVLVPIVCIAAPIITYILNYFSETLFWGYKFGFELLLLNGLLTFLGLLLISQKK
ncbi:MAG: sodium:solute symporter [Chitinophagales bacterium]